MALSVTSTSEFTKIVDTNYDLYFPKAGQYRDIKICDSGSADWNDPRMELRRLTSRHEPHWYRFYYSDFSQEVIYNTSDVVILKEVGNIAYLNPLDDQLIYPDNLDSVTYTFILHTGGRMFVRIKISASGDVAAAAINGYWLSAWAVKGSWDCVYENNGLETTTIYADYYDSADFMSAYSNEATIVMATLYEDDGGGNCTWKQRALTGPFFGWVGSQLKNEAEAKVLVNLDWSASLLKDDREALGMQWGRTAYGAAIDGGLSEERTCTVKSENRTCAVY